MLNILVVELTAFLGMFNAIDCVYLVQTPFICFFFFFFLCHMLS